MPEAVKEVVTEVPLAALKKESTPDEVVPCKEVKPAEASSGTLPADKQPQKDAGEGEVAPDVGQAEAPEQGKSETLNDVSMDKVSENSEKDVKNDSSADRKEQSTIETTTPDSKSANSNNDNPAEESKEATSDESPISQESKQPSPEECQIDESKQASPEESKTEQSMETGASNEPESTQDIKETKSDNKTTEKDNTDLVEESTKLDELNEKGEKDPVVPKQDSINSKEKDESMETNTDMDKNKEEAKETKTKTMDVSKEDQTNNSVDSNSENKETTKVESVNSRDEQEHKEVETTSGDSEKNGMVQSEASFEEKEKQESKVPVPENGKEIKESMEVCSAKTAAKNNQGSSVDKTIEEVTQAAQEKSTNEVAALSTNSSECNLNGSAKSDIKVENLGNETEGAIKDEKKTDQENDSQEKEITSCSGSSKEIDSDAAEEVKQQIKEGKALLLADNYFSAADILGKACEAAGKLYGELANENAELYYLYGCAMLECAKNESNVLGEGVKEKDEEEDGEADEEEADAEVNGDEKMETEENGDGEEESMAVDDEGIKEKTDSEQPVTENGHEDDSTRDESTKEKSEEEEEDSSLKVAWEMFELAKIAFTRMGNDERLADTYIKLGEVGIESGHKAALDDMKAALELRKKSPTTNQRLVSETHFNLGLGFATFEMFDEAIEQFKISKSLLEAKIDLLIKVEEEKAKEEIKNIKELLPDLEEKIQDMQDSKVTKEKQTSNGEPQEPPTLEVPDSAESSSKPVSNITHLVKRKRKLEDVASDLLPSTKQQCTEKEAESDKPEK